MATVFGPRRTTTKPGSKGGIQTTSFFKLGECCSAVSWSMARIRARGSPRDEEERDRRGYGCARARVCVCVCVCVCVIAALAHELSAPACVGVATRAVVGVGGGEMRGERRRRPRLVTFGAAGAGKRPRGGCVITSVPAVRRLACCFCCRGWLAGVSGSPRGERACCRRRRRSLLAAAPALLSLSLSKSGVSANKSSLPRRRASSCASL
jgi:hypothetical protein